MSQSDAQSTLVDAVDSLLTETDAPERLEELKQHAKARREREHTLWYMLVLSFSTLGNSQGSVLATDEKNYQRVSWETVAPMDADELPAQFSEVLHECTVRFPNKKARQLTENVQLMQELGGPAQAMEIAEAKPDTEAMIEFVKQFTGIGPKYARAMWMDLHHPAFRDTIALDQRISNVSEALGLSLDAYETEESFYQDVAAAAGLSGWELDRLLYRYTDDIIARLD